MRIEKDRYVIVEYSELMKVVMMMQRILNHPLKPIGRSYGRRGASTRPSRWWKR